MNLKLFSLRDVFFSWDRLRWSITIHPTPRSTLSSFAELSLHLLAQSLNLQIVWSRVSSYTFLMTFSQRASGTWPLHFLMGMMHGEITPERLVVRHAATSGKNPCYHCYFVPFKIVNRRQFGISDSMCLANYLAHSSMVFFMCSDTIFTTHRGHWKHASVLHCFISWSL